MYNSMGKIDNCICSGWTEDIQALFRRDIAMLLRRQALLGEGKRLVFELVQLSAEYSPYQELENIKKKLVRCR